jgi:hypothetical protein
MNPHIPKWTPTLGVGTPMDSQIFKKRLQGSKLIRLKSSLYHWKSLGILLPRMGLHYPFGYWKHKWGPKERPGVKLLIWLPTTKSWESPQFICVQVAFHILLESSRLGLWLYFRPHFNRMSAHKIMDLQSRMNPNSGNFGTPIWKSHDKITFGCWSCGHAQRLL